MSICVEPVTTSVTGFSWEAVRELPEIWPGELHTWLIKIEPGINTDLEKVLSFDEIRRSQNFRLPLQRARFVASRAHLRRLIGNYLDVSAGKVNFVYSEDGKPSVGMPVCDLTFNLSHSDEILLIAFRREAEVGADIERVDSQCMDDGTVSRSLHANELNRLRSLSDSERAAFFFDCWTKKEAYLKLLGCGFAIEPNEIDLSSIGNESGRSGMDVHFIEPPPIPGYRSAVATNNIPTKTAFYTVNSTLLT